jgi:hypothetical protein
MTQLEQYKKSFSKDHDTKVVETKTGHTLEISWVEDDLRKTDKLYFDKNGREFPSKFTFITNIVDLL